MELNDQRLGDVLVVAVQGRVDTATAPTLAAHLEQAIAQRARTVLVDLAAVDYVSSAGFRALLVGGDQARAAGERLHLCAVPEKIRRLFDVGGFSALFTVHADRVGALAALADGR